MLQTFDAGSPDTFQLKHRLQLTKSKCKTKSLSNSTVKKNMSLCWHEHNVPPGVKRSVDFFFEQGLLFRLDPDQGKRH